MESLTSRYYLMKRLLFATVLIASALNSHGQGGTLRFANADSSAGVRAPVYMSDKMTPLSGPQFQAELMAGALVDSLAPLASTGFLTGATAGFFIGPGPGAAVVVPDVAPGTLAFVQVLVWNTASGATFDAALASGLPDSWWASTVFSVRTGNAPLGGGPTLPAPLVGLGNSPVYLNTIPEPSTFSLAGLGVTVALFQLRRNRLGVSQIDGLSPWDS